MITLATTIMLAVLAFPVADVADVSAKPGSAFKKDYACKPPQTNRKM